MTFDAIYTVGIDMGDPKGDLTIRHRIDATPQEIDEIIALEYLWREWAFDVE